MTPLLQQTLEVGPCRDISVEIGEPLILPEITSLLQQCDQVRCTVGTYKDHQHVAYQRCGECRFCESNLLSGYTSGVVVLSVGIKRFPYKHSVETDTYAG